MALPEEEVHAGQKGVSAMVRAVVINSLDEHPNLRDLLAVLAQVAYIDDAAMAHLARSWRNTAIVAQARSRALEPDSPLVLEVLAAFDALSSLYADDIRGAAEYVTLAPELTVTGLKAVRDAIAATYARPILSRLQYHALLAPWRAVYPNNDTCEPDLGPAAEEIKELLAALTQLSSRCHEQVHQPAWDGLLSAAGSLDGTEHALAVREAWEAAVSTGRRRVWSLVRRSAAEGLGRCCTQCRRRTGDADDKVLSLGMDAVGGLLVCDVLAPEVTRALTAPVAHLIPAQRHAS
ncbi:MAG: hypothetical protein ACYDB7_08240 [Mycobacteriales bacterium]